MEQRLSDVSQWRENTQIHHSLCVVATSRPRFPFTPPAGSWGLKFLPGACQPWAHCSRSAFPGPCAAHISLLPPWALWKLLPSAPLLPEHSWLFLLTIWSQVNAFPTTQNWSMWHQDFFFHVLSAASGFLFLPFYAKSLCGDICRSFSARVSWN